MSLRSSQQPRPVERDKNTAGQLSILFLSFQFSFFLWFKQGLFLLFSFAFIFFPLIAHISFSLSRNTYYGFPLPALVRLCSPRVALDRLRGNDPPTPFGLWRASKTYTTQTRNFRQGDNSLHVAPSTSSGQACRLNRTPSINPSA